MDSGRRRSPLGMRGAGVRVEKTGYDISSDCLIFRVCVPSSFIPTGSHAAYAEKLGILAKLASSAPLDCLELVTRDDANKMVRDAVSDALKRLTHDQENRYRRSLGMPEIPR